MQIKHEAPTREPHVLYAAVKPHVMPSLRKVETAKPLPHAPLVKGGC